MTTPKTKTPKTAKPSSIKPKWDWDIRHGIPIILVSVDTLLSEVEAAASKVGLTDLDGGKVREMIKLIRKSFAIDPEAQARRQEQIQEQIRMLREGLAELKRVDL